MICIYILYVYSNDWPKTKVKVVRLRSFGESGASVFQVAMMASAARTRRWSPWVPLVCWEHCWTGRHYSWFSLYNHRHWKLISSLKLWTFWVTLAGVSSLGKEQGHLDLIGLSMKPERNKGTSKKYFGGPSQSHNASQRDLYIYIYSICSSVAGPRPPHPTYGIPSYATTHYMMGIDKSGNCPAPPVVWIWCWVDLWCIDIYIYVHICKYVYFYTYYLIYVYIYMIFMMTWYIMIYVWLHDIYIYDRYIYMIALGIFIFLYYVYIYANIWYIWCLWYTWYIHVLYDIYIWYRYIWYIYICCLCCILYAWNFWFWIYDIFDIYDIYIYMFVYLKICILFICFWFRIYIYIFVFLMFAFDNAYIHMIIYMICMGHIIFIEYIYIFIHLIYLS